MLYHLPPCTSAPSLHHKAHFSSHHALVEGVSLSKSTLLLSFSPSSPSKKTSVAPNQRHSTNQTRLKSNNQQTTRQSAQPSPEHPRATRFLDRSKIQLRIIAFPLTSLVVRVWRIQFSTLIIRSPSTLPCKFPHCPAAWTSTQCLCVIHRLRNQETGKSPPFTSRQGIAYHSIGITSSRLATDWMNGGRCELDEPISLFLLLSLYISTWTCKP